MCVNKIALLQLAFALIHNKDVHYYCKHTHITHTTRSVPDWFLRVPIDAFYALNLGTPNNSCNNDENNKDAVCDE